MRKVFLALLFIVALSMFAGTTGKIVGRVYDASTRQGLPGVNVIIEGTTMGAATDLDGYFIILNVPPGTYDVTAQMIGYQKMTIQGVQV
ncbi:carboxypeptidase-like regulatory domain-containing protein, partial [candidate division WOR-3 bacterium]|nr:carboxypeptidase-like regulatory domain-containing protein [candidate division WOR-3 bacterium]